LANVVILFYFGIGNMFCLWLCELCIQLMVGFNGFFVQNVKSFEATILAMIFLLFWGKNCKKIWFFIKVARFKVVAPIACQITTRLQFFFLSYMFCCHLMLNLFWDASQWHITKLKEKPWLGYLNNIPWMQINVIDYEQWSFWILETILVMNKSLMRYSFGLNVGVW